MIIDIGIDVSKGYSDIVVVADKKIQGSLVRYNDTPYGRNCLVELIEKMLTHGITGVRIGVESTGGLERNWVRYLQKWCKNRSDHTTSVLITIVDPRAVKSLANSLPERCKTDQSSAYAIARYLDIRSETLTSWEENDHQRSLFRALMNEQNHIASLVNQIKSLLIQTHPSLVYLTQNGGITQWMSILLQRYPTTKILQQASVEELTEIPRVTRKRAIEVHEAAQKECSALVVPAAAAHMSMLINNYIRSSQALKEQWRMFGKHYADRADYKRLRTIPGIGEKTACAILSELPELHLFTNARATVAFAGVDPTFEQSGDGLKQTGISHRGPARLRQTLYTAALSGMIHNPTIAAFYRRLRAAGKCHGQALTACMRKLLCIAYACVVNEQDYQSDYEKKRLQVKEDTNKVDNRHASEPIGRKHVDVEPDVTAPVSVKEKRRRKRIDIAQKRAKEASVTREKSHEKTAEPARDQSLIGARSSAASATINKESLCTS